MSDLADLLAGLAGAPALPGARCRGRSHLFDEANSDESADIVAARHRQALDLCGRCPSRQRCGDWLLTLTPAKRPTGVVAGRIVAPRRQGQEDTA